MVKKVHKVKVKKVSLRGHRPSSFSTDLRSQKKLSHQIAGRVKGDNFLKNFEKSFNFFVYNQSPQAKSGRRSFWFFLSFSLALILFLKILVYSGFWSLENKIKNDLYKSASLWQSASFSVEQGDLSGANRDFYLAAESFSSLEKELGKLDELVLVLSSLSSGDKYRLLSQSRQLSKVASVSSRGGQNLTASAEILFSDQEDKLSLFISQAQVTEKNIQELEKELKAVKVKFLPAEWQSVFSELQKEISLLSSDYSRLLSVAEDFRDFLGYTHDRRYLLIFQNNTEMRASGGFIGSYALVDFRNGKIRNLEVPSGGAYDMEGGMRRLVKSPEALWLVSPRWYFWDANWFPDWPTTARNLMWFYEHSGGSTVDGVVSFTPTVFEDLLEIIGPLDLTAEHGLVVSADNFYEVIQNEVEREENKSAPKKIIYELLEKTLEKVSSAINQESWPQLLKLLEKNWRSKQFLLYLDNPELEKKISSWTIAGKQIENLGGDYLMVVNSNIAGQKTDRVIKQDISLGVEVSFQKNNLNHLSIVREHQGVKGQEFSGVRNVNWLRLYVPRGSKLLSAEGFTRPEEKYFSYPEADWENSPFVSEGELWPQRFNDEVVVYNEGSYTVFAGWTMLDPGECGIIKISYESPLVFQKEYSLIVQKQAGDLSSVFNFSLAGAVNGKESLRSYPALCQKLSCQQALDRDLYFYYLWPKSISK